ncbi:MAG: ATP-binding protein [Pseudomonas sp.]
MKIRARLFLSTSALLTVALLGLLLGLFSVLHLTKTQNQAMTRNLSIIEATLGLSHELSRQVTLLLAENLDREALMASDGHFRNWLEKATDSAMDDADRKASEDIRNAYSAYSLMLNDPLVVRRELLRNDQFGHAVNAMRDRISAVQMRYVSHVNDAEEASQERAWLIAGLLGLLALAVLLIGLVTANSIAQRFGRPIESLARAADRIGQGDFKVVLPITPISEMATLSRRFGLMADSLQAFRNSDVAALQAEQKRLQAVLDSIDDGLLIFDCAARLEHINPVASRQLGCGEQHLGKQLGEVLKCPELDEQLHQLLAGDYQEQGEQELQIDADGESRTLSYSLSSVTHNEGHLVCAVMVLRDITEQRAFERVRSEFVLRASHELRTPVAGMHMAFALLRERLDFAEDSREQDLTRTVDEEMQRLVTLINDLLNFSRYQNGLQKIEPSTCNLEGLLEKARQRFVNQASERDITLEIVLQGELPTVEVDCLQIERVLDNLIGNALRHTPHGGHITLHARRQSERVIIGVEDDGEGIPFSQQARIFEPFVQVSGKKGGAGLGLALCKEIVQLHGGHMGVHSKPGQGAHFYLAVPL